MSHVISMNSADRDIEATYDLVHQAAMSGIDKDADDWHDHPMFRTDLPNDVDEDRYLSMFQHVMYKDETPETLAVHFKELGNELFRSGKHNWLAAANWWTRGLEEKTKDDKLRSVLHSNRATVSLGLGQYQKAALDANWAIKYDHTNKKAFLRAAHAYQGMSNWDKAIEAAKAGLEITPESDPIHKPLQEVVDKVTEEMNAIEKRVSTYYDSLHHISNFLKQQNISVGRFLHSWMGNWETLLRFDEDKNESIWPIAITFDEVLQVDFVEGYSETAKLSELLKMVLPGSVDGVESPPWDTEQRYKTNTVILYVQTSAVAWEWGRQTKKRSAKNIEVNPECSLKQIFSNPDYIVPGYPIIGIAVLGSTFAKRLNIESQILPNGKTAPATPQPDTEAK